ncbi:MAG: DUF6502 family protein [Wenzhouxiangella sp.]|nr:DUF6502 family protein [Wenzhouxiangella sp.]
MGQPQHQQEPEVDWVVSSAQNMFKPIAQLLVGKLSCQVAVDLLKEAYIEEATRQLIKEEGRKRATKSALALKTGLDTRAISALEAEPSSESLKPADLSPEAAVLNAWSTEKTYQDEKTGKPKVLPVYGRGVSFQTLVMRNAGRNVTCPTVLGRLADSGNIEMLSVDEVRMVSPHYIAADEAEQTAIEAGSVSMNRLGQAIAHNLRAGSKTAPWLQEVRWSRRIPEDRLDEVRRKLHETLKEQIAAIEQELDSAEAPVRQNDHHTLGVGWYYWEDA